MKFIFYINKIVDEELNKHRDKDVKTVLSEYCFSGTDYGFTSPDEAKKDGDFRWTPLGLKFEVIEIEVNYKVVL